MNNQLLIFLFVIGIAFIVFGVLILFLPEVIEGKEAWKKEQPAKEKKRVVGLWWQHPRNIALGITLGLITILSLTFLTGLGRNTSSNNVSSAITSSGSVSSNTNSNLSSSSETTTSNEPSSSLQPSSQTIQFTVTFVANGGTEVQSQLIDDQGLISIVSSTREHFTFEGWYTSNDAGLTLIQKWDFASDRVSGEFTLYANWIAILYTITFESNGGSEVSPIQYAFEATLPNLATPIKSGETFAGWFTSESLNERFLATTMPGQDITLFAKWVINPSTILFQSNGGTTYPNLIEEIGTSIDSLPTPFREGALFLGWFTNMELTNAVTFPLIMNNLEIELFAKWLIRFEGLTTGGLTHYLISETGELYGFGYAVLGSLLNITSGRPSSPVKLETPFLIEGETMITAMNAGDGTSYPFSVFLTSNGRLFSIGSNNRAQLGVGDKVDRNAPTEINLNFLNENEKVTTLSLGIQHSMILTNQNRVFTWGYGAFRALGQGSSNADLVVPTIVNFPGLLENEFVSKIYGFTFTSIAITSLNRVYMWGNESEGLGELPTTSTWGTPRVITIANLQENEYIESFKQAAYGVYNVIAKTNLNRYMIWGRNSNHELNDGLHPTTRRSADALNLDFIQPNQSVIQVVAGSSAIFVLTDAGTLYSWGAGSNGQLGHGDALQKLTPTQVDLSHLTFLEGEKITNVSTSNTWNFAFTNEGRLLAWGRFYTSRPQFI